MKKVISYFLSILTVFSIIAVGFAVPASAADSSWSEAFKNFIDNKEYAEQCINSSGVKFALRNIGGTDAPELIVADGHEGGTYGHGYVYTLINGKVNYVGSAMSYGGAYGAHCSSDKKYPGLVNCVWDRSDTGDFPNEMPFHIYYSYIENNSLKQTDVAADYNEAGKYQNLCNDENLFKACVDAENSENWLKLISEDELNKISWNDFCKKYGYSVETEKTTTPQKSGNTQLTDTQKKELEKFLNDYLILLDQDELTCLKTARALIMVNHFDIFYPGDIPQGAISTVNAENYHYYTKVREDVFDKVLKDVFNYTDNEVKSFRKSISSVGKHDYYSNGYYYFYDNCEMGGWNEEYNISIINVEKIGEVYIVEYQAKEEYSSKIETYYCQVKYKTFNGVNYWSLYKNSKTKFSIEETTNKSSDKANTVYTKNVKDDSDTKPTTKTFKHSLEYYIQQKESTEYNPELAELLMWFAHSAYIHSEKFEESPEKLHIRRTYQSFGFDVDDKNCYRNYNYFDKNNKPISSDNEKYCGWSVGVKDIENGKKLVMITVRGTSGAINEKILQGKNEWWGNLCVTDAATFTGTRWHRNFNDCADKIYASLKDFDIDVKSDKYIFCLTGHSKGAGVANLTAMLLDKNGVDKSRVYDYNFACPDVAVDYHTSWNTLGNHDNIFNICNACDLVTYVPALLCDKLLSTGGANPLTHWGKYGVSKWFSLNWNDAACTSLVTFFANITDETSRGIPGKYINERIGATKDYYNPHDPLVYLAYMSLKAKIDDSMVDRETAATNSDEVLVKAIANELAVPFDPLIVLIKCPVDFTVTNLSGNVLAECVDNKPKYYDMKDNYILIGVEGDKKSVLVANPSAIKINIVATDSGTMEFSAEHLGNALTGKEDANGVSYTNIALEKGKKMLFGFDDVEKLSGNVMFVVDENESPIAVIDFDGKENSDTKAIEKAEKQTEDAGESKKISKKTIIIISAVSALILLAAAIILIKKAKASKTKAVPEEEPISAEPQEEYRQINPAENTEITQAKEQTATPVKQAGSEIKLRCVKCEAGGICSMCKSETEQLYSVTATKDGKTKTITVCRNCGEKIVRKYKNMNQ